MSDLPPPFGPFDAPPPFDPSGNPFQPADPFKSSAGRPFEQGAFELPGSSGAAPAPPAPPLPPGAPAPPPPELQQKREQGETPLSEYLWRRLESLEQELQGAQRQALESQSLLKNQEELKTQVETQLRLISEQVRREKAEKDIESEKSKAHGRVDALEKRLDEMHQTWAQLLREAIGSREGSNEQFIQEMRNLRSDVGSLQQQFGQMPQISPQIEQLKAAIPGGLARWEEDARRLELSVSSRLTEIERRMGEEMERQRDRVADLMRERAAVEQAIGEQRTQLHQEFMKERVSLLNQFQQQSGHLEEALERLLGARDGEANHVRQLGEMINSVERILREPPHAKDEVVRELDKEKRELMNTLKERAAQFHAFTTERREVERSLGESLLKFQRELDEARAHHVKLESRIAELQMQVQQADARAQIARQECDSKDQRFALLAQERDDLSRALMNEAGKVRDHLGRVAEADEAWSHRVEHSTRSAAEEKQKRIETEAELADLKARVQSLSDHLARALQEKDQVLHSSSAWQQEKENLMATLKKKDEMISMLSSTFKNLLKK
ncbi:MAG: hypothetical protein HY925_00480 [Elusimicrobia bacterium]|nr:hypothetical protein [Elusimicrobiota bacterium]